MTRTLDLDARRTPVIVGVGQINDRPEDDSRAKDTLALMQSALELADRDAGGGILRHAQSLGIVEQMSWPTAHWPGPNKITPYLLTAIGISPRHVELTAEPSGDGPVRLLHDAANRIAAGEVEVAAVVGAEALRTESRRAAARAANMPATPTRDLIRTATERAAGLLRSQYGLLTPTDVYPLYENACRAAWRQTLADAQAETAAIWSGMSAAAADNPGAWLRRRYEPAEILAVSSDNRPISFPYTKLMVANNSVNQGAAVIVASLSTARRLGVPDNQCIYLGPGAAAHEADDFLARDRYDASPSMSVAIRRTLELNELTADDLDWVELYSCFPCMPKMARRILPWPLARRHSVYGGLTFGGGPIGNCMMHAAVTMTQKLRQSGRHGFIFANGGYATHNHCIVLRRGPPGARAFPQSYDYQSEADALRAAAPRLSEHYTGPGVVETYVVPYARAGNPEYATVVARNAQGERFLSRVAQSDAATLQQFLSGAVEPVGRTGHARLGADGRVEWRFQ